MFGRCASGGYAEYATAAAGQIAKKPEGVSHEEAAAIPVAGLTAWEALFATAKLEKGQTAVVAGAAGGVGHFACAVRQGGGRAGDRHRLERQPRLRFGTRSG